MQNQKIVGMKWDFLKNFSHKDNAIITKNIIDFVGAQITSSTNADWTKSISYKDLSHKISLVYRRQKTKFLMPAEKNEFFKRKNVLKTRRLTVS